MTSQVLARPQVRITHNGFPGGQIEAYIGHIETLGEAGLLRVSQAASGSLSFDVRPQGFACYEELKRALGEPGKRIQTTVRNYVTSNEFERRHPLAYQRWCKAEELLWTGNSPEQLSTMGHLCREAMQEFATSLIERCHPPEVDEDKSHTVARVRQTLAGFHDRVGEAEAALLDALLVYWGCLNDLVQRQEHAAQKEGHPLIWEDGRRAVFQTAITMFEIDKTIQRIAAL